MKQILPGDVVPQIVGPVYWIYVYFAPPNATLRFETAKPLSLAAFGQRFLIRAPAGRPWRTVTLSVPSGPGFAVLYGEHPSDAEPLFANQDATASEGVAPAGLTAIAATRNDDFLAHSLRSDASNFLLTADYGFVSQPAIYDVTSAPNTALDTGIIDTSWSGLQSSAWRSVTIDVQYPLGVAAGVSGARLRIVDDAGVSITQGVVDYAVPLNGRYTTSWGRGASILSVNNGVSATLELPRRFRALVDAAGVGNTIRMRIEGRR